jgi:hypothetical protein
MAAEPSFVDTPVIGVGAVSIANTARDGNGTIVNVVTATLKPTKVVEVRFTSTGDLADGQVNVFLNDGSATWFFDSVDTGNPAAASVTVDAFKAVLAYQNLILPVGWSLRASITVAPTSGVVNVFAHGGSL